MMRHFIMFVCGLYGAFGAEATESDFWGNGVGAQSNARLRESATFSSAFNCAYDSAHNFVFNWPPMHRVEHGSDGGRDVKQGTSGTSAMCTHQNPMGLTLDGMSEQPVLGSNAQPETWQPNEGANSSKRKSAKRKSAKRKSAKRKSAKRKRDAVCAPALTIALGTKSYTFKRGGAVKNESGEVIGFGSRRLYLNSTESAFVGADAAFTENGSL